MSPWTLIDPGPTDRDGTTTPTNDLMDDPWKSTPKTCPETNKDIPDPHQAPALTAKRWDISPGTAPIATTEGDPKDDAPRPTSSTWRIPTVTT
jgi:hypothetical protein